MHDKLQYVLNILRIFISLNYNFRFLVDFIYFIALKYLNKRFENNKRITKILILHKFTKYDILYTI